MDPRKRRVPLLLGLLLVNGALLLWPGNGQATMPPEKVAMGSCSSCYDAQGTKVDCCVNWPCSACNCRDASNC